MMNEMARSSTSRSVAARGFTLLELLLVVAIIALLTGILAPSLVSAKRSVHRAICASNLRHTQMAFVLYLDDNEGNYFPYRQTVPEGTLWYWGLEGSGPGGEGGRPLDKSRARLARYFPHVGNMETCPSFPYDRSYFKRKFAAPSYGYAINRHMLGGLGGSVSFGAISRPAETVAWAESIQINTWQAPASPDNPMLEEWYYLDNRSVTPATFHFRHGGECGAVFADGHVAWLAAHWLDPRCDGLVGRPEEPVGPAEICDLLRLDK